YAACADASPRRACALRRHPRAPRRRRCGRTEERRLHRVRLAPVADAARRDQAQRRADHPLRELPPAARHTLSQDALWPEPPAELIVNCDGGSRGNPGPAAFGVAIQKPDGTEIEATGETIGIAANHLGEYTAAIVGLERCAGV